MRFPIVYLRALSGEPICLFPPRLFRISVVTDSSIFCYQIATNDHHKLRYLLSSVRPRLRIAKWYPPCLTSPEEGMEAVGIPWPSLSVCRPQRVPVWQPMWKEERSPLVVITREYSGTDAVSVGPSQRFNPYKLRPTPFISPTFPVCTNCCPLGLTAQDTL